MASIHISLDEIGARLDTSMDTRCFAFVGGPVLSLHRFNIIRATIAAGIIAALPRAVICGVESFVLLVLWSRFWFLCV